MKKMAEAPELTVSIIADLLANHHDWNSSDIRAEFISVAADSQLDIDQQVLEEIFDEFQKLDPRQRFDPAFDHAGYVRGLISS